MPETQLCTAPIIGGDGNVYAVVGTCRDALRKCGFTTEADELSKRIMKDHEAHSYDEALAICMEYCEPVNAGERPQRCGPEDPEDEDLDDEDLDEDEDEEEDDFDDEDEDFDDEEEDDFDDDLEPPDDEED